MKKIIHKIILVTYMLSVLLMWGQQQNENWYFGYKAGLNFNSGTTVLTNGETTSEYDYTASISDTNGDLLFYTNGRSVWNKNHQIMTNGNNSLLGGLTTVIVPFPGNADKYYIFTLHRDFPTRSNDDVYYSVVNMQNGIGVVESLNTSLNMLPRLPFGGDLQREVQRSHMTVTKHSDGESYWLVIDPFNVFFAYKIDTFGIQPPVISNENGEQYYTGGYLETINGGCATMSISPDASKLSFLNNYATPGSNAGGVSLQLYNFNNTSGNVSLNSVNYFWNSSLPMVRGASLAFSPNSSYLYTMGLGAFNGEFVGQFNANNIMIDPIVLFTGNSQNSSFSDIATMQLAKDGKIYIPGLLENKLSVINNPNNLGIASNAVKNQVDLLTGSTFKLPQLVPIHTPNCASDLIITQTVLAGVTDAQQASNMITAINTIQGNGIAEYHAGESVLFLPGFEAKGSSSLNAYIEGCTTSTIPIPIIKELELEELSGIFSNRELKNNSLLIYPNPIHNYLNIKITDKVQIGASLKIFNIQGKLMYEEKITREVNNINIEHFAKGLYIISIKKENILLLSKKIIKN